MKISVHSDLHFEGYLPPDGMVSDHHYDVMVLAGDIVSSATVDRLEWIRRLNPDKPVVYVPGNHEYYRGSIGATNEVLKAKCDELNIHFGNRSTFVVNDVHFVCATGWSDLKAFESIPFELKRFIVGGGVADFTVIGDHSVEAMIELSELDKAYIEEELERLQGQKVVVVTHFAPTEQHGNERFAVSPISSYFCNNWIEMMYEYQPLAWIYGHTHGNVRSKVYSTDVICNQRGYGNENQNYDPNFIHEVT